MNITNLSTSYVYGHMHGLLYGIDKIVNDCKDINYHCEIRNEIRSDFMKKTMFFNQDKQAYDQGFNDGMTYAIDKIIKAIKNYEEQNEEEIDIEVLVTALEKMKKLNDEFGFETVKKNLISKL